MGADSGVPFPHTLNIEGLDPGVPTPNTSSVGELYAQDSFVRLIVKCSWNLSQIKP